MVNSPQEDGLVLNGLTKILGGRVIIDNLHLVVKKGEMVSLLGPSGCGKTTLGRTLLRLVEPDSGSTVYKNIQVNDLNTIELRTLRKKLQIIFQDPYSSLNPRFTIGEAIIEPMRVHKLHGSEKAHKDKVVALLHKVGLEARHYARPQSVPR